ncbi:zinc finger, CCHC-type containing protein [Tanacetum coccineum]
MSAATSMWGPLADVSATSTADVDNTKRAPQPDSNHGPPKQSSKVVKDFLKLVDSLNLDVANRERTRLCLFQFSFRDQASNWLERLPAGSISTMDDLTTRFLSQFFPPGRTTKLRNDILMFQQHQVDYTAEGQLRKMSAEKAWNTIEELARYEEEGWNDPIFLEEGSLNYKNANIEQLLGVMECQVDTLMNDAISLMGKSGDLCGLTSNTMRQLPLEPSYQEEFEGLVTNFILDQEEKVFQLEEYMCVRK